MNYFLKMLMTIHTENEKTGEQVKRLYEFSQKSLVALIIFALIVIFYLYSQLQTSIVIWGIIVIFIALLRLISMYFFNMHQKKYTTAQWHTLFMFFTALTAILVSMLSILFIPQVDEMGKLFIIASLVGISSGAMSSLFPDIRIMVLYISIIIIPLIFSIFMLHEKNYFLFGIMLIVYYITQMAIAYNSYKQNMELNKHQEKIRKTQEELYKNKEILEHFYTQAPMAIFSYDLNLKVTACNEAFLKLFHLRKKEVIELDLNLLPDQNPLHIIRDALKGEAQSYTGSYLSMRGLEYWVEAKSFPIHDHQNKIIGGIVLLENKTNEHEAVEKLKYLASHDALTQLSNRRGFKEYMDLLIKNEKHNRDYSLLFYLDLNHFNYINDSLGHTFGDKLLKEVAIRLKSLLSKSGNLTRLGGDEFVIVLPFITNNEEEIKSQAQLFAQKIHQAFEEPFILDGVRLYVKTSIGIVIIEPGFDNIEEIVRHADISMYQAKKHGLDHISFYNNALDEERKETFSLQQDLIYALENDGFEIYLQPIVNIDDNSIKAAEALIRWKHPKRGILYPVSFIPLAIELGVITEIGWWVLSKVCHTIQIWKEEGIWNLDYISININAKQLIKADFTERFFSELEKHKVNTQDIKIEITETSLIDNFELTQKVIEELQERGIKCVIDDFGTGYSSLSYLKKLSFSVLKIDREFIFDLENNDENETLIRTIVEIAKQFNYNIVVEGIEKEEQREIIKKIDGQVSYQGFLISEAIPLDMFKEKFIGEGAESSK